MAAIVPGTRLGRYEVHEYAGAGTLGPIHRAYDATFGTVTLQVLSQLSADALPAFRAVAPRLVPLRHPNLACVLDSGEHEGVPYVVTELDAGGTLPQRLRSGVMGWDSALDVLDGVAAGIDHAHRNAVVHGSLRPDRVVLAVDGRPLGADAGLEPLRRPAGTLPPDLTGERAAFLAPEQAAGFVATAASDRYALATLAYLLLAGRTPFAGQPADVVRAQVQGAPPPASRQNPRLGAGVDRVLQRGLAREPDVRWQSGAQFVAALREALGGLEAPAPVAPARQWRPWAVGGAAVLLAALVGFLVWRANQQPNRPSASVSSAAVQAGGMVTVSGSHLPANQVGSIELASSQRSIGAFQADPYGSVHQDVRIPVDVAPGDHVLSLCWQSQCPASARLTVTAPSPSSSPTSTYTPAPTATPTRTLTPTPTPRPTHTPTPTPTPTRTTSTPSIPVTPSAGTQSTR